MTKRKYILCAFLAAAFYALNAPLAKLFLSSVSSSSMAGLLYLGSGLGMLAVHTVKKNDGEKPFEKKDTPYIALMIVLDCLAPIFLMEGLKSSRAENVALLNNFEIVATTMIAVLFFKERIRKKTALAIVLITLSSFILSFEGRESFHFSLGSLLVILACACWGLENNATRKLSHADPALVVIFKGIGSGGIALMISVLSGNDIPDVRTTLLIMLLGFVSYGLSILFYVYAQRGLGAARTSSYYAIAPFIGVFLSLILFKNIPSSSFYYALLIMLSGVIILNKDSLDEERNENRDYPA